VLREVFTFIMKTTSIKIAILALVLFGLTACSMQTVPNMVDYSYVPQSTTVTVTTAPGIESY
jgi:ABC-type glycerol-3-phosphate transport system substrate-binding protein